MVTALVLKEDLSKEMAQRTELVVLAHIYVIEKLEN